MLIKYICIDILIFIYVQRSPWKNVICTRQDMEIADYFWEWCMNNLIYNVLQLCTDQPPCALVVPPTLSTAPYPPLTTMNYCPQPEVVFLLGSS